MHRALLAVTFFVITPYSAAAQDQAPVKPPSIVHSSAGGPEVPGARRTEPESKGRLLASIAGGYGVQNLYGTWMSAGDVEATVGEDLDIVALALQVDGAYGSTQYGLGTIALSLGEYFEGHVGRLHFGLGIRQGWFSISRETMAGSLSTLTLGAYTRVSFDLCRFQLTSSNRSGIFVFLKGSVDHVGDALWGATGGLGVRL